MSVYRRLTPRIFVPLYERLSGRRPWTELRRLRELQWRSPEELEARALAKLRPLLAHAHAHVPYYRELFARAGLRPEDIETVSDLSRLPLTGKAELRANFPARVVADNLSVRRRPKAGTSGSTGLPFEFYLDRTNSAARTPPSSCRKSGPALRKRTPRSGSPRTRAGRPGDFATCEPVTRRPGSSWANASLDWTASRSLWRTSWPRWADPGGGMPTTSRATPRTPAASPPACSRRATSSPSTPSS